MTNPFRIHSLKCIIKCRFKRIMNFLFTDKNEDALRQANKKAAEKRKRLQFKDWTP